MNFKGTTYESAVEFERLLAADGYDTQLNGQPGGPRRTPVVTVRDSGFFHDAADLEREVGSQLDSVGGGRIQSCLGNSLGN